jgi:hypothetical protein
MFDDENYAGDDATYTLRAGIVNAQKDAAFEIVADICKAF